MFFRHSGEDTPRGGDDSRIRILDALSVSLRIAYQNDNKYMIDVDKIKQLREKTGAGIADCREALEKSDGDLIKAQAFLKEKGIEKAAKKADRKASEGIIEPYVHSGGKIGVLVELNCETDFVARTDDFKHLAHEIAMQVSAMNPKNVNELLKQTYIRDQELTVHSLIKTMIAKLGENIIIRQFTRLALGE